MSVNDLNYNLSHTIKFRSFFDVNNFKLVDNVAISESARLLIL